MGLNEVSSTFAFKVYPNPANNEVNITSDEMFTMMVYDVLGKQVDGNTHQNKLHTLNTSLWSDGVYFLHITGKESTSVHKLEVKH